MGVCCINLVYCMYTTDIGEQKDSEELVENNASDIDLGKLNRK